MVTAIDKTKPVSERMVRSVMSRYKPEQVRWHYEHGMALQSIFLRGKISGQSEFLAYTKSMYDTKITPLGDIVSYREAEYNLDLVNPGKTLFLLYKEYGEEKYRVAMETLRNQLRNQPRTKSGGFWHKQIYPWQMWLDGLYMQGPFYAQYLAEYAPGDAAGFEDLVHQFTLVESKTRDEKTGLLYHAWDESREQRWANPHTGCSPHFWGRAMGWYGMALADVLDFIPPSYEKEIHSLKTIAARMAESILRYQDSETGLWYQVLDRGQEEKNYTESSASSMFVYFLRKIARLGAAPKDGIERIKAAAARAYQGLLERKIREEPSGELHLTGICKVAGLGGNPYRDGSYGYYISEPVVEDDFKGVGPFILASMETERADGG